MSKFKELINGDTPTLVDFFATWCGPCQTMSPVLDELKKTYSDQIRIIKIDVDKNPVLADQFKIRGVPTLILFKEGKVLWKESGAFPLNVLKSKVGAHL